jgi:hypothetical protein
MKEISRRLRKLEERHVAQRNEQGLTPADVFRQRLCRYEAEETGRPYEELLQGSVLKSQAFWASYDGDRSLVGVSCGIVSNAGRACPGDAAERIEAHDRENNLSTP